MPLVEQKLITPLRNQTSPRYLGILDISVPGHFGTDLDISVLGTGQFGTWMRQFGTDHNCLVLINCQYFGTSSSLIYDPKVDGYVFLIVPV